MSGNKSREKGKRGERRACQVMEDITGVKWRRTSQVRGGVSGAPDIEAEGFEWLHVEVKACAKHPMSDVVGHTRIFMWLMFGDWVVTPHMDEGKRGVNLCMRHRVHAINHLKGPGTGLDARMERWINRCMDEEEKCSGLYSMIILLPDRRVPLLLADTETFERLGIKRIA